LSARNVQRIVEFGAGWMPVAAGPNELAPGIRTLRDAFAAAGHDPDALRVSTAAPAVRNERGEVDLERTLAALPELAETGIGVASFALARFARRPEDIRPFLERLGRRG
jgi:alkanesulfonate monooxygenase SsuD/methylene tetrahydromethanopterin reductase-like flavin-dependent oxidoreductase (luciferase family)